MRVAGWSGSRFAQDAAPAAVCIGFLDVVASTTVVVISVVDNDDDDTNSISINGNSITDEAAVFDTSRQLFYLVHDGETKNKSSIVRTTNKQTNKQNHILLAEK